MQKNEQDDVAGDLDLAVTLALLLLLVVSIGFIANLIGAINVLG